MKADADQLKRIHQEGWQPDEMALRAGVPRDAVMRWQRQDYASMPYEVAEHLVAQANGIDLPSASILLALYTLRARRAGRGIHT